MRLRPVLVPVAAALASALVPGVAHAAVPKAKPIDTLACGKKTAQLWNDGHRVAAKNSCSKWLVLEYWYGESVSDPGPSYISLAPGAHVNIAHLNWADEHDVVIMRLSAKPKCDGALYWKNSHGKVSYCS